MNVKTGTQTWSKSEQTSSQRPDKKLQMSASEKAQFFGDSDNIGQVLNKITDPNYVDPSKKLRAVGDPSLDKDAFLSLLLAQMKNQDPTNPLKSHEMAAQLAQFTSLEKLTNINESIENLAKAQNPNQNYGALNLIGKSVEADSSKILRANEKDVHGIRFQLGADATQAKVVIKDAEGKVVRELQASSLKKGENEITWNGTQENGQPAKVGSYTASLEAEASNGAKISAVTKFSGVISGVSFSPQGPVLKVGNQDIPLGEVREISDPKAPGRAPVHKAKSIAIDPALRAAAAKATELAGEGAKAPEATTEKTNALESVGMSREMINKLKDEGIQAGL